MIPIQTIANMAKRQTEIPTEMLQGNIDSYLGSLDEMGSNQYLDGSSSTLDLPDNQQLNPELTEESAQISPKPNFSVIPFENPMDKFRRTMDVMKGNPTAILESGIQNYLSENNISIEPKQSFNVSSSENPNYFQPTSNNMSQTTERQQFSYAAGDANVNSQNLSTSSVDEATPQAKPMSGSFDSLGAINSINNSPPSNRRDYT